MKKLLSLALALFFSMAVFAQDVILYDFENGEAGWTVGDPDDVWQEPWNNWFVRDVFNNGNSWWASFIGEEDGELNHALFSPTWSMTTANAGGSISFGVFSAIDGNYDEVVNNFALFILINGQATLLANESLSSNDGYKKVSVSFQRLIDLNVLTLSSTPVSVQFAFLHKSCTGGDGALLIDDFIIRKRAGAYFVYFEPYQCTGTMSDMITGEGGTITMPNSTFTAPSGETFAFWQCYYVNDDGIYDQTTFFGTFAANAPVQHIDGDIVCYAITNVASAIVNYNVTYNANGGSGNMPTVPCVQGSGHVALDNAFTAPAGKHFVGWADNAAGTGELLQPGDWCDIEDGDTGLTLYAIWADNEGQGGGEQGGGQGEGGGEQGGGQGEGGQGGGTSAINSVSMANISIYPNPAHNMIRVNGASINSLEVMDLTGRKVLRNEGVNTIDLSGLNNGVYMLRINANEGVAVRKIVKK
ncbi:MAG: T9SS type A sorting domain-containing protein [Bacteroidales bacterium]|nr:T9SS type A sorting domain-containing protein [Bacteroidales bacterium]